MEEEDGHWPNAWQRTVVGLEATPWKGPNPVRWKRRSSAMDVVRARYRSVWPYLLCAHRAVHASGRPRFSCLL